jgi:transposase
MPYKSEKINIKGTKHDRRRKLTDEQKVEIHANKDGLSQRKLAARYGVSRSTVRYILMPEKLVRNRELRELRGGSKQYYNKETWAETVREHRKYKQDLFLKGEIEIKKPSTDKAEG